MKSKQKTILVPTDFTKIADYALQHAIRVSNILKSPISILHIVKDEAEIASASTKLDEVVKSSKEKFDILLTPIIRVGNIFVDIAKTADEINAEVVVMGSSTIKQMDKNYISPTLRVITSSKVPFVVIQEPPTNKRYDNIVFPIDHTTENKTKHLLIPHFSDNYLSKFHLVKPNVTDPKLLAQIDMNMASALKVLDEKGARYSIETVPGKKPYEEEILDTAVNIRADLIILMTTPLNTAGNFIFEPVEQHILTNAGHIPIMCINPQQ